MKSILRILIAAVALSLPTVPAMAIDGDKAIALCNKNPKCKYRIQSDGEVVLTVDGSIIMCPLVGECICAHCPGPAKIVKPGNGRNMMSIPKLLQQGAAQ